MESDAEKTFPEGVSELQRTASIIERRERDVIYVQFFLPQTSVMRIFTARKNVSIKNSSPNCHCAKYSTRSIKVLMMDT